MFSKNYLNTSKDIHVMVPMGTSVANQRVYLPTNSEVTGKIITGIVWNEGGFQITSPSIIGGISYTFLNSNSLPCFTLTLVNQAGDNVCRDLVLSTLGGITTTGKIRRFACMVQMDKCYITNIVTTAALVATAAISLTFYYK